MFSSTQELMLTVTHFVNKDGTHKGKNGPPFINRNPLVALALT